MENDFEDSMIMEKLAERGLVEDFLEAVDSDNLTKVVSLLRVAGVDQETIDEVLKEING